MIQIQDLSKRYGARQAIDGVTFTAADGAITGLLGANGAGKTTTFRIVGGLMRADGGSVGIDGLDARDRRARQRVGVLPHRPGVYGRLTAREHLAYFGALHGLAGPAVRARVDAVTEQLGLTPFADRPAATLSEGERARLALGCAMIHDPRHLVLDEPASGLDVLSVRALHDRLRALRNQGTCILFSTHVMSEAASLCDRLIVIARGRIVAAGTADDLRREGGRQDLEDAFVALTAKETPLC